MLVSAAASAHGKDMFVSPSAGEALSPGAIVEVSWEPICRVAGTPQIDEAEIVLSLDGGRTFPMRVSPELKPCTSKYLWKVPALPTGQARLALRTGIDEWDLAERLEIVSAGFRILAEPDGRVEQLLRRMAEWWIVQEPEALTAEDLLERRLGGPPSAQAASAERAETAVPGHGPGVERPRRQAAIDPSAGSLPALSRPFASARFASASTPLRL